MLFIWYLLLLETNQRKNLESYDLYNDFPNLRKSIINIEVQYFIREVQIDETG